MDKITSAANQRVKDVVLLSSKARERKKQDVFLVEGKKMFLEAPVEKIKQVYVSESFYEKETDGAVLERLEKLSWSLVSDEVFRKMSDTQSPQGVLCIIEQFHYTEEQLFDIKNPLFLVLEDLQDPGNLGTIVRTGEGAGVTGILMSRDTVDIYNPKTIRATMGSVYRMPFLYCDDLHGMLKRMKEKGIRTYAAHLKGEAGYDSFSYKEGTAFLIGNEGNGLKQETADLADSYLRIPMKGQVESLNAAIAATILMYEALRQRG